MWLNQDLHPGGFRRSLLIYWVKSKTTVCRRPGDEAQGDLGAGAPGTAVFSTNWEGGDTCDSCLHRGSAEILWIPVGQQLKGC